MQLLQSVLATLPQTKKPQRKFITHLLGLVLMLPGHATFRNLSRYSSYHERTPDRVRVSGILLTSVTAPVTPEPNLALCDSYVVTGPSG